MEQSDTSVPVVTLTIKTVFDVQGNALVWYARPQLSFNCSLCRTGPKGDSCYHKEMSLVYFSTFEPTNLTPDSVLQRAGVPMLHESASNPRLPCLYICTVTNIWGKQCQAPLIPYFIGCIRYPSVPVVSRTISIFEVPQLTRRRSEIRATVTAAA